MGIFNKNTPPSETGRISDKIAEKDHYPYIELHLISTKVFWPERPPIGNKVRGRCYMVIFELIQGHQSDDENIQPGYEMCTTKVVNRTIINSGMEWNWDFWFCIDSTKHLRFELWESSSIFGHTIMGKGVLNVPSVPLDTRSEVTSIEIPLLPPSEENGMDSIGIDDITISDGTIFIEVSSDLSRRDKKNMPFTGKDAFLKSIDNYGKVEVSVEKATGMMCLGKSVYLVVKFGGEEHRIEDEIISDSSSSMVDITFDSAVEFNVYNINHDVKIKVYESSILRRSSKLIGQVTIPISTMINRWSSLPPQSRWFQIFPPVEDTSFNREGQYRTAMQGTTTEGFGLTRQDTNTLGKLKIKTHFTIRKSALLTYMLNPLIPGNGLSEELGYKPPLKRSSQEPTVSLPALKLNFRRIQKQLVGIPVLILTIRETLRWQKNKRVAGMLLAFHIYSCWMMPQWQLPLVVVCLGGLLGLALKSPKTYDHVYVFKDEVKVVKMSYSRDAIKDRYEQYKAITHKVQLYTDHLASIMEKLSNLLAWNDIHASSAALFAVLIAAFAASLVLYVFEGNKLKWLYFLGGMGQLIPKKKKKKARTRLSFHKIRQPTLLGSSKSSESGSSSRGFVQSGNIYSIDWERKGVPYKQDSQENAIKWNKKWGEIDSESLVLCVYERDYNKVPSVASIAEENLSDASPKNFNIDRLEKVNDRKDSFSSLGSNTVVTETSDTAAVVNNSDISVDPSPKTKRFSIIKVSKFKKKREVLFENVKNEIRSPRLRGGSEVINNFRRENPCSSLSGSPRSAFSSPKNEDGSGRFNEFPLKLEKNCEKACYDSFEGPANSLKSNQSSPKNKSGSGRFGDEVEAESEENKPLLSIEKTKNKISKEINVLDSLATVDSKEVSYEYDLKKSSISLIESDFKISVNGVIKPSAIRIFSNSKTNSIGVKIYEIKEQVEGGDEKTLYLAVQEGGSARKWRKAFKKVQNSVPKTKINDETTGATVKQSRLTLLKNVAASAAGKSKRNMEAWLPKKIVRTTPLPWSVMADKINDKIKAFKGVIYSILNHIFRSTPDDLDLEHRYICSKQVVENKEPEVLEQSAAKRNSF